MRNLKQNLPHLVLLLISFSGAYAAESENMAVKGTHSWAGYHIGVNLGKQTNGVNQTLKVNDPQQSLSGQGANADQSVLLTGDVNSARNLSLGGIHADYLLQAHNIVYGITAELFANSCKNGTARNSALSDPTKAPPDYTATVSGQNCLSRLAAIKGKLGMAFGEALIYVDGGLAFGRSAAKTVAVITNTGNPPSDVWSGSNTKTLTGYIIGAGVQYALVKNVSAGLRMSRYDLGRVSYTTAPDSFTAADQPGVNQSITGRVRGNLVQIGLDYSF